MESGAGHSNDESVHGEHGANVTSIKLIGYDRPFFTALAVVLSIFSAALCFFTEMREERRVYFTMRCEGFIEQAAFDHKPVPYTICGPREK